jgi:hypothetical protein
VTSALAALPNPKTARLPVVYEEARAALATCEKTDECASWAKKAEAIASYARQAEDETLLKAATRIKGRAIRRCGELLKEIKGEPRRRSDLRGSPSPRVEEAKKAGLSRDKMKQAIRVASVPSEAFEALIEADRPATVPELAARGKRGLDPTHLRGRDPKEFNTSLHARGDLAEFARTACMQDPAVVLRGAAPHDIRPMVANAKSARVWLTKLLMLTRKRRGSK